MCIFLHIGGHRFTTSFCSPSPRHHICTCNAEPDVRPLMTAAPEDVVEDDMDEDAVEAAKVAEQQPPAAAAEESEDDEDGDYDMPWDK